MALPHANLPVWVIVPVKLDELSILLFTALCLACTFNLLVVIVAILVLNAVKASIKSPVLGDVIAVMDEL